MQPSQNIRSIVWLDILQHRATIFSFALGEPWSSRYSFWRCRAPGRDMLGLGAGCGWLDWSLWSFMPGKIAPQTANWMRAMQPLPFLVFAKFATIPFASTVRTVPKMGYVPLIEYWRKSWYPVVFVYIIWYVYVRLCLYNTSTYMSRYATHTTLYMHTAGTTDSSAATPGVPQESQWISRATMWEALLSFRDHRSRSLLGTANSCGRRSVFFLHFWGFHLNTILHVAVTHRNCMFVARWMNIEKKMTNTQQPDHIWTVGQSYDSVTSWQCATMNDQESLQTSHLANTLSRLAWFDHLGRALRSLGWEFVDGTTFQDESGRSFSLCSSSLGHIRSLLLYQWGQRVAQAVCHRKGLDSVQVIDTEFSRPSKSLLPSERGLLGQLVSGRHFTCDARSKFAGATCSAECPHCQQATDSREHRVFDCPAFEVVRWHYKEIFQLAPRSALLYGLWPFPDGLVDWQASLDQVAFPVVTRSNVPHKQCLFTDGSCLFPSMADIRVAAAAVVVPAGPAQFKLVWSGILPTSNQTIQRAEILAGAVATASALHPVVISDSLYFVRLARKLLQCWVEGKCPDWPSDNLDLWEYFWSALSGCSSAEFVWTKAHRSFEDLDGLELLIAQGNDAADSYAKQCVRQYQATSLVYRRVVQSKLQHMRARSLLDAFHVHLALSAVGQGENTYCPPSMPDDMVLSGTCWKASRVQVPSAGFHERFVGRIFNWFLALQWFSGCSASDSPDISWVELFLFWVVDCGCVPPFKVDGKWVCVGVDEDAICCVPSAYTLFRTWRRAVTFVLRDRDLVPGVAVPSCNSAVALGARFVLPGLSWRPRVPLCVRRDLCFQFSTLESLHGLRLPPVW